MTIPQQNPESPGGTSSRRPQTAAASAIRLAREALAELGQVKLSYDPAAEIETTAGYWVGRLKTALTYLADTAEAELGAGTGRTDGAA